MQVERIDHIHVKVSNLDKATDSYDAVMGTPLIRGIDHTDHSGIKVSFGPFPLGLELMEVTDVTKEMAAIYNAAPDGVFALSYKVPNMDVACAEMEELGHKLLMRYEFGEIKEALFDTKEALAVYIELIEYSTADINDADHGQ